MVVIRTREVRQLASVWLVDTRFSVAPAYLLTLLENMQPLMQTLLECGANANLMAPPNVVSPLYYLMRVVCSMSPTLLGATADQVGPTSSTAPFYFRITHLL